MEKYYPNGVFVNPDYVEELFDQLTQPDKEKLLNKLCSCPQNKIFIGPDDWKDAIDWASTRQIVDYIGEIELLDYIDRTAIANYVDDHGIV